MAVVQAAAPMVPPSGMQPCMAAAPWECQCFILVMVVAALPNHLVPDPGTDLGWQLHSKGVPDFRRGGLQVLPVLGTLIRSAYRWSHSPGRGPARESSGGEVAGGLGPADATAVPPAHRAQGAQAARWQRPQFSFPFLRHFYRIIAPCRP